jgi:trehalose 2-sulfotransferase
VRQPYDLATAAHDVAHGHHRPRRSILVCTMRRCGSTLLGEALARAGLGCPLEYFHAAWRPAFEARWSADDLRGYAEALYQWRTSADGTLGVKLFWPDVLQTCQRRDPARAHRYTADLATCEPAHAASVYSDVGELVRELFPGTTVVLLWRRDLLRQAVSDVIARQHGRWRELAGTAAEPAAEPAYDPNRIDAMVRLFRYELGRWRACLDHLRLPTVEVVYEDLAGDYGGTVRRLLRALLGGGWDGPVPPPRLRRQADTRSERLLLRHLRERHGPPAQVAR